VSINEVKKASKGGDLGSYQAPIETNILNTQIRAFTCPMAYYPLSHKSIKKATSNKKRSLYGQIVLQGQHHGNKKALKWTKVSTCIHTKP